MAIILTFLAACAILDGRRAEKPPGTHYSAAYIRDSTLVVFPFDRPEVRVSLPANLSALEYSAGGRTIYGVTISPGTPHDDLVAVRIRSSEVEVLPSSSGFKVFLGLAVNAAEDEMIVSAVRQESGANLCGLFKLKTRTKEIEHIIDNLNEECADYLSTWSNLSLSPDGTHAVGTAKKGQLGLVNVKEHKIERLWRGTRASWSPDGKWIAAISFDPPTRIQLIDASNFLTQRDLGGDRGTQLKWSPDSKYLLLWESGFSCGFGVGYVGTYYALNIETGQSFPILSSKCRVDRATEGWVDDAVIR